MQNTMAEVSSSGHGDDSHNASTQESIGLNVPTTPFPGDLQFEDPPSEINTQSNMNLDTPITDMDDYLTSEGKSSTKAKDDKQNTASPAASLGPRYDPKDLISPKTKRFHNAIEQEKPSHDDAGDDDNNSSGAGNANLIEKLHNVQKREGQIRKRQKTHHGNGENVDEEVDEDEQKRKAHFTGGRKGGILGEEIKKLQGEGPGVVDLTASDDEADQDVIMTKAVSTRLDPAREVCLGTLHAKIMAAMVPAAPLKSKSKDEWPLLKISLQQRLGDKLVFEASDLKNNVFGKLDFPTASAISPLMSTNQLHHLRMSAWLLPRKKEGEEKPLQPISKQLDTQITLYASAHSVEGIGRHLSQRNVFLFNPSIVEQGREVINPHVPKVPAPAKSSAAAHRASGLPSYKERTVEEIHRDVLGMFDRLVKIEELPEAEADTSLVKTPLMPHQKQALYFFNKQEEPISTDGESTSNLWKTTYKKDGTKSWYHVITGDEVKSLEPSLGGLFADSMGLGKTLSTLARICASIKDARAFGRSEFVDEPEDGANVEANTGATLIVCPKSVLSNWIEQINAHLDQKGIRYYMYHGPKREQDIDILAKYDIVITAYTTVGSEFASNKGTYSAIGKLKWYRVVLDEAHMIRNQDTGVFKAACAINSKRRWAVTGTPIQNRLEDLGALIKFMKVNPFYAKGAFEQHFLAPFKRGDPKVLDFLHLLVGSITLRRNKDKIDLPDRREDVVRLDFSDSERALYEAFAKDSNRKVRAMTGAGGRFGGRGTAQVLVNITRLRAVCAHGSDLLSADDMKLLEGSSYGTAIELGEDNEMDQPALSEAQVYDTFYLLRESNMDLCACCADTIGRSTDGDIDEYEDDASVSDAGDVIGYLTPCLQPICPKCVDPYRKELAKSTTKDNYATCPQCEQYIKAVLSPIRQSGVDADLEHRRDKKHSSTKKGNEYSGPHTKVKALIHDLEQYAEESKALLELGEPPIRSVVFSGWTAYLDLIELALANTTLQHLRLDGRMSVSARTKVLDRFRSDPSISLILVSIKAGGQGLNFTAANKVFMMEPQFNPGVEMQAVDRVHRLGQKRDVHIKRFIMRGSFEEKILELQNKKLRLAKLATAGRTDKQDAQAAMKDLLSLFH